MSGIQSAMRQCVYFFALCVWFTTGLAQAQIPTGKRTDQELRASAWRQIAPYFIPPPRYQDNYGDYRSPLRFYDGRRVTAADQWQERREEILQHWSNLLGPWPALFKDQQFEFLGTIPRDGFTEYTVRFLWTPHEQTKGYLLVPHSADEGPMPAVITVYYEPETAIGRGKENRDFALQLTRRGFVTLSIGTAMATEAKRFSLYYPGIDSVQTEPLSMLACAAANAWHVLANSGWVDSSRIGIMGHSFGGKWAMFASCLYEKFAAAVWSDPGIVFDNARPNINYWEPWYLGHHARPWRMRGLITKDNPAFGVYPKLIEEGYDLHELHALMAPRPFLVSGGEEDTPQRWVALNHAIEVNGLLGYEHRVAMTNRATHAPTPESNEAAYLFFEYFLK